MWDLTYALAEEIGDPELFVGRKFSPQIVAGSYIGWLGAILRHMTGRYVERRLEGLSDEEALAAVYDYGRVDRVAITDETAPYVAEVCARAGILIVDGDKLARYEMPRSEI
jgi:hypothetical protein